MKIALHRGRAGERTHPFPPLLPFYTLLNTPPSVHENETRPREFRLCGSSQLYTLSVHSTRLPSHLSLLPSFERCTTRPSRNIRGSPRLARLVIRLGGRSSLRLLLSEVNGIAMEMGTKMGPDLAPNTPSRVTLSPRCPAKGHSAKPRREQEREVVLIESKWTRSDDSDRVGSISMIYNTISSLCLINRIDVHDWNYDWSGSPVVECEEKRIRDFAFCELRVTKIFQSFLPRGGRKTKIR